MVLCSHFASQALTALKSSKNANLREIRAKTWIVGGRRLRRCMRTIEMRVRGSKWLSANSSGAAEALRGFDFMPTAAATGPLRPTPSPRPSYKLDLLTTYLTAKTTIAPTTTNKMCTERHIKNAWKKNNVRFPIHLPVQGQ